MATVSECVGCLDFPCQDVDTDCYLVPDIEIDPGGVKMVMISEAAPEDAADYYYAPGEPLFAQTTVAAFKDAGAGVSSVSDLLEMGVYLTTGIKCGKTGYTVEAGSVKNCSRILEEELALFPNVRVLMLMGDVAIKAVNYIAKRRTGRRAVPAGSTYKIRGGEFLFGDIRVSPSYLQAGKAFFIEKSKREMIAEDLGKALALL
jgi:hypothetical protein